MTKRSFKVTVDAVRTAAIKHTIKHLYDLLYGLLHLSEPLIKLFDKHIKPRIAPLRCVIRGHALTHTLKQLTYIHVYMYMYCIGLDESLVVFITVSLCRIVWEMH